MSLPCMGLPSTRPGPQQSCHALDRVDVPSVYRAEHACGGLAAVGRSAQAPPPQLALCACHGLPRSESWPGIMMITASSWRLSPARPLAQCPELATDPAAPTEL